MSVKREDLIKAAKELNDVLGLDPQIKTGKKVTEKELSEQILEAAELILPEDGISDETMKVIKILKGEVVDDEDTEVEELEEVEEDEDSETEKEEVEDEVDEPKKTKSEMKKGKKVEKEQKVKKDMKSNKQKNKQKKENISENDRSKSNKAIVYEAWKSNITDIKELAARVNNRVKESTIKTWITQWKKGKNLPAIARKKDDK
jgi:hypothetical protein